jgi:hypothetical protein
VNATVLLANFAKVSDGMLDVQGGGWTVASSPVSFFVAGLLRCDWHETNQAHTLRIELLDADGAAVPNPQSGEPIALEATVEIGRPPGTKPGSSFHLPFAQPFGAFELEPGSRYEIRVRVNGEDRDEWRLPFTVRDQPPQRVA